MGFSTKQVQALRRSLSSRHIRTREANGRKLSYIEGWYSISEANRIFGFDGWNRETLDSRCVLTRENRGSFLAVYTAKVRITVQADGVTIVREGHGSGEGRGSSPGEVHDTALKASETDATKRALATFGKPFGLELYRKDRIPAVQSVPMHNPRRQMHHRRNRVSGHIPTIRHQSRGHRITMDDGTITRWPSYCVAIRPQQKKRLSQPRHRWHLRRPSHQRPKSTKANSPSPNLNEYETGHT